MRVVQHTAYRTRELANRFDDVDFASTERQRWEADPIWQGFRELQERLLVTWDWGQAFVALNLVAKPAHDAAVLGGLGAAAAANGDRVLQYLNDSHLADSARSRRWTGALVTMALGEPSNRSVIQGWVSSWMPLAQRAVETYLAGLPGADSAADPLADVRAWHASLGLD